MPDLGQLVDEVNAQIDMSPNLASYKAIVVNTLNRHYLEVSGRHPWLFLQREKDFNVYATVTGSSSQTVSVTNASYQITFAGITPSSTYEGQTFIGPDGTTYTIAYVSGLNAWLGSAYTGSTVVGSSSWSLQYRAYALPTDCSEPLGFIDRANDRGRLLFIDRRKEEAVYLDRDNAGDVFILIEDDHLQDRAPDVGFSGVAAAGGTLTASNDYEYCYTFLWEGRESPPSPIITVTTTTANKTVNLSGMEDTRDGLLTTGRLKRVYRRDKTAGGRWLRLTTGIAEATQTYVDDGSVTPSADDSTALAVSAPRQYVRAYFTASEDRTLRLRYLVKPRRLAADSDVPVWPETFHHLLVYLTLQDLFAMHGGTQQAILWERRAKETLERMKGKWLSRSDRAYIREGFESGRIGRGQWPATVTKSDA